jgi:hypothetical protein
MDGQFIADQKKIPNSAILCNPAQRIPAMQMQRTENITANQANSKPSPFQQF